MWQYYNTTCNVYLFTKALCHVYYLSMKIYLLNLLTLSMITVNKYASS